MAVVVPEGNEHLLPVMVTWWRIKRSGGGLLPVGGGGADVRWKAVRGVLGLTEHPVGQPLAATHGVDREPGVGAEKGIEAWVGTP